MGANERLTLLITECKKQNRSSQKLLYKEYFNVSKSICSRYAANDAEAVHLLNISFLNVFSILSNYGFEMSFQHWLKESIIKSLASQSRFENIFDYSRADQFVQNDLPCCPKTLNYEVLLRMIQSLPRQNRYVYNLYAIDSYQIDHISSLLGINSKTVKFLLGEARCMLYEMILNEKRNNYTIQPLKQLKRKHRTQKEAD